MKLKNYLLNEKQLMTDNQIVQLLSKGLKHDTIFNDIAVSLRKYIEISPNTKIILQKNRKTLMDELWYRIGSPIQDSENFDETFMKKLKKNFYDLKNTLFKNYKKENNTFVQA